MIVSKSTLRTLPCAVGTCYSVILMVIVTVIWVKSVVVVIYVHQYVIVQIAHKKRLPSVTVVYYFCIGRPSVA